MVLWCESPKQPSLIPASNARGSLGRLLVILVVKHTQTVRRKRAANVGINASIAMNLEPK